MGVFWYCWLHRGWAASLQLFKINHCCKSDPCVRIQYYIYGSELALELSPEVPTSTLRVRRTWHTEGMYPYHTQSIQHTELADMGSRLELCRWINPDPHTVWIVIFFFTEEAQTMWTREKNYSNEFSALQEASTTLQCFVRLQVLWPHEF